MVPEGQLISTRPPCLSRYTQVYAGVCKYMYMDHENKLQYFSHTAIQFVPIENSSLTASICKFMVNCFSIQYAQHLGDIR